MTDEMNSKPDFDPSDPLLLACRRLSKAMHRFDAGAAESLGLDPNALRAIHHLEYGPRTAGEIAQEVGLASGSVTALLRRLEASGAVSRHADATDRRKVIVSLKPETFRDVGSVYRPLGERVLGLFAHLTPLQRAELVAHLTVLASAYAEGDDGSG